MRSAPQATFLRDARARDDDGPESHFTSVAYPARFAHDTSGENPPAGYAGAVTSSFPIARIKGIEIGAHWSWLLVFALIIWSLSAGVFPTTNPGLSDAAYFFMALAASILFFTSLIAHELGHALQARREGMTIAGITLWVFGGVAQFTGRFPSAGAELRIAAAGPLVSLVLGLLFLGAAVGLSLPAAVDGVLFWLGQMNIILLLFNLMPALPLDGGRILRAALWWSGGDFQVATRTAAGLGRFFGYVLIGGGLGLAIFLGAFGGMWLAFIGWFILAAAEAEERAADLEGPAGRLHARDVMVADPVSVRPDLPLDRFMDEVFLVHRHTAYPVRDDGRTLGLISFRDVLDVPDERRPSLTVADRMTAIERTVVLDADTPLPDALAALADGGMHRALVREGDRITGLLSITDVTRVLEANRVRRR